MFKQESLSDETYSAASMNGMQKCSWEKYVLPFPRSPKDVTSKTSFDD
jgi:hypothetical protein